MLYSNMMSKKPPSLISQGGGALRPPPMGATESDTPWEVGLNITKKFIKQKLSGLFTHPLYYYISNHRLHISEQCWHSSSTVCKKYQIIARVTFSLCTNLCHKVFTVKKHSAGILYIKYQNRPIFCSRLNYLTSENILKMV